MAVDEQQRNPYALADAAASVLADRTRVPRHTVALVLGSGWASAADELGEIRADIALGSLPGFPAPKVSGHRNAVMSVGVGAQQVLVFGGRSHLYEGHPAATVVHGVRTAIAAGCRVVILTNAAGGLDTGWRPGQPVLISDQLNLTGFSPMAGDDPPPGRPGRFCDMTDAYSPRLRTLAREVDPDLPEGVYAGLFGGAFETPAEIRMIQGWGADLVGMSTVLETIAARHLGAEVLGVSLVTNLGAGLGEGALDHTDVLATADAARPRMIELLQGVIEKL